MEGQEVIWTVIAASFAVYSWKILGYLVPEKLITPAFRDVADRVTVALLAALGHLLLPNQLPRPPDANLLYHQILWLPDAS